MNSGDACERQDAFAAAAVQQLRRSRHRQRLTQADVARLTGGAISAAALANYETGQRSLRVGTFWTLAKALGEDPGLLLHAAELACGNGAGAAETPLTVDTAAILRSTDARLAPVRRWFAMRLRNAGARIAVRTVVLDPVAITALADLMGTTITECRLALTDGGAIASADNAARTAS